VRTREEKYSYVATFDEIKENEFNLNIPTLVDTFEEAEAVDSVAVQKDIDEINESLVESEEKMKKYIRDLGF
jgi:type I restriction enzyme M protein